MCKIHGFCKYSLVLESFVNYVFFMHPVIFNTINKLMKKKLHTDLSPGKAELCKMETELF